ncbi:methyltransferase domain-containing protein [Breoghania sp. L-A4]|uniref:methyltransferase domain-containing protein n=1 Tax=Breoghania sp. L-A4 TaxID=2304600 RepID=UPI000E35890A|nr:methyltransferase domain-containing protein [Breoghania sp. L-A4]AXS42031.1 methyltransferase domain-containing protein [Breoghania sp. L-A4]
MTHDDQIAPFNRRLLALRRARALKANAEGADFLLALAAEDLAERLETLSRTFPLALDLGGHTGRISAALASSGKVERVIRADLFAPDVSENSNETSDSSGPDLVADDESLPFANGSLDLVVSSLSLQWANDLPGALIQIRKALKPDGLFLGALIGGETLHELRDVLLMAEAELTGGASPRVAPFADTREIGGLLQRAGFALPVADQDRFTVRYDTLFDLMRDLRAMGATSVLRERGRAATRAMFLRAAELYAERHADPDGRIRATFQMLSLSGWAPHESQQKPLAPGSAKVRLADALGTREIPTGETPS